MLRKKDGDPWKIVEFLLLLLLSPSNLLILYFHFFFYCIFHKLYFLTSLRYIFNKPIRIVKRKKIVCKWCENMLALNFTTSAFILFYPKLLACLCPFSCLFVILKLHVYAHQQLCFQKSFYKKLPTYKTLPLRVCNTNLFLFWPVCYCCWKIWTFLKPKGGSILFQFGHIFKIGLSERP